MKDIVTLVDPGFVILGFNRGQGEVVFEKKIDMPTKHLISAMRWSSSDNYIGADYELTAGQILEIERLTSLVFPKELDLYLTSYE